MARTNISLTQYKTRDEFEGAIDEIARLQVKIKKLEAERDIESQKVLDRFNPEILELTDKVTALQNSAMPFAMQNSERLFGKGRSASCSLAIYGFRKGSKKIVNITGQADNIVAKELYDAERFACVEVAYKLNRKEIQKALKNNDAFVCARFGEQIEERFYVDAKTDKDIGE